MAAPRRSPVEAVLTGVVATLQGAAGLTALVSTRVFTHVPQATPYPYVAVTSPTDVRRDTFGRKGAEVIVDVKAVSQAEGDREAARVIDQCIRALDFTLPTVSAHQILGLAWDGSERFEEVVNGIRTKHHVATFRAWAEQSTT